MLANSGCRCHGTAELAKFEEDELHSLLLKYKSGEIEHRVMSRHADRYTKEELADIAAYYASM
jgi:cytochrome c553